MVGRNKYYLLFLVFFILFLKTNAQPGSGPVVELKFTLEVDSEFVIGKYLHSVFAEVLGDCVYDGIWVGKKSSVPNINGIRKDFIDGCREAGVTAIRWPGGVFADSYHWKYGIGPNRKSRMYAATADLENDKLTRVNTKSNEFGTDEFIELCRLAGCEPIIVANTATGSPEELYDWFEYCNGDSTTFWGSKRTEYGHPDPYNVTVWALGNTDDNAWHIAWHDPLNYAHDFLRFRTAIRRFSGVQIIGLGYSLRHGEPEWVGKFMEYVTKGGTAQGPNSLSVHHYSGGAKSATRDCGPSVSFTDEQYYYSLGTVSLFQKDIEHHRAVIEKYTKPPFRTTISFDEWGFWHPDTRSGLHQSQTVRDGIFAALSLHTFYRNCDIVEYAMVTQVVNVLQSLFETRGENFYKTPTFYVLKLFKAHLGQYYIPLSGPVDPMLDCVMSATADKRRIVLTLVNKHLSEGRKIAFPAWLNEEYAFAEGSVINSSKVRDENTFENPYLIVDRPVKITAHGIFEMEPHSVYRLIFNSK
jgi:alpha-L-arabinofuranosidase